MLFHYHGDIQITLNCLKVTSAKVLRTAFGIRRLSSASISRVFIKTKMVLKSRTELSSSRQLVRSRSTDNLPTSQSQVNIQMMSHTLTIREVGSLSSNSSGKYGMVNIGIDFPFNRYLYMVSKSYTHASLPLFIAHSIRLRLKCDGTRA